ncbi:MAG: peptidoglycan-binding domain-containing protein [Terracidiphilus sp.]
MLLSRACFAALLSAALFAATGAPAAYASHINRAPTSGGHHSRRHHRSYRHHSRVRGQKAIQPERVEQIQQALIRTHYLSGDPTGKWDATTVAAMQKFQADNGWQTKITPDSRALVKLGLGEDYSDAINAKNLTLASPPAGASVPANQEEGFAVASGVSQ